MISDKIEYLYCTCSEIPANTSSRVWAATPKVALAARSIKRHADTVTEFNAKLLDAIRRKDVDKADYIRYSDWSYWGFSSVICIVGWLRWNGMLNYFRRVLRRSVIIEYSGVEDHEREGDKMTELFLGKTRAERQKAIEGWSEERLRACDELVEELQRCRRGFYVYNSVKANYQKAAGVIRRLISEGPRPPPHLDPDHGIDDAPDERGIDEMGSEWDYDSFMVLTEDEEDMAEAEDASEDSDAEAARAGLVRGASRLRQMHSAPWRREEDHNNNLSGAGSSSSSGGDSGNASMPRSSNPRFDGNDSIGDDYDADCEDGEDNGDEDGADGDGIGEDDIWE